MFRKHSTHQNLLKASSISLRIKQCCTCWAKCSEGPSAQRFTRRAVFRMIPQGRLSTRGILKVIPPVLAPKDNLVSHQANQILAHLKQSMLYLTTAQSVKTLSLAQSSISVQSQCLPQWHHQWILWWRELSQN